MTKFRVFFILALVLLSSSFFLQVIWPREGEVRTSGILKFGAMCCLFHMVIHDRSIPPSIDIFGDINKESEVNLFVQLELSWLFSYRSPWYTWCGIAWQKVIHALAVRIPLFCCKQQQQHVDDYGSSKMQFPVSVGHSGILYGRKYRICHLAHMADLCWETACR